MMSLAHGIGTLASGFAIPAGESGPSIQRNDDAADQIEAWVRGVAVQSVEMEAVRVALARDISLFRGVQQIGRSDYLHSTLSTVSSICRR
jgi:hypothetical protein